MRGVSGGVPTIRCAGETRASTRRSDAVPDDDGDVSEHPVAAPDPRTGLLALYDSALPQVYGYLLSRCSRRALAEDLTAETFLAAVDAVRREPPTEVTTPWLVGVARHKLVDHWRRQAREDRALTALAADPTVEGESHDPWTAHLDVLRAQHTLERLGAHHRAALTLRYVDDLPVPRVAELLDRTVHATETLLVRARAAFRRAYAEDEEVDGRD